MKKMTFGVPMIWREQADRFTDCYFFLTNIKGFSKKQVKYSNCRLVVVVVVCFYSHPKETIDNN